MAVTPCYRPGFRHWPVYAKVGWILLILLAIFPIVAPFADLVGIGKNGIPADHSRAFSSVAGLSWDAVRSSSPGVASFITQLETGYALHELTFGLLFLAIVIWPLRHGDRWAWIACWAVLIADIGYTLTIARYDPALFRQSLIALVALPILLLAQAPRILTSSSRS